MLDRRKVLTIGGVTGAALFFPIREMAQGGSTDTKPRANMHHMHRYQPAKKGGKAAAGPPPLDPFSVPMPLLPVLAPVSTSATLDCYQLPIQDSKVEVFPGLATKILSYGGQFVGPTIKAKVGKRVQVKYRNELGEPANVHLHGGHTPAASDGYPTDLIAPGATRSYYYPNKQAATTLWYHDHAHHMEADHVFRGLHGFYIIEDDAEKKLGLPSGQYDVPIMMKHGKFDEDGQILFAPDDDVSTRTTFLVNGRPQPYFQVAARKYRIRFLNASNHGNFNVNLGDIPFVQIGSDGGLLAKPLVRKELFLSPAERADVILDFTGQSPGAKLVLNDTWGPVMRFDVVRKAPDESKVPDILRTLPTLPPATKTRNITLQLSDDQQVFWIDGKPFDPNRVDATIKRGTTEIWKISNLDTIFGGIDHNFHMHLVQFRVLDRDGQPPWVGESGFKDTVSIPPGTSVRVQATFGEHLGKYTYHCHMMEHSSAFAMMATMEIVS